FVTFTRQTGVALVAITRACACRPTRAHRRARAPPGSAVGTCAAGVGPPPGRRPGTPRPPRPPIGRPRPPAPPAGRPPAAPAAAAAASRAAGAARAACSAPAGGGDVVDFFVVAEPQDLPAAREQANTPQNKR